MDRPKISNMEKKAHKEKNMMVVKAQSQKEASTDLNRASLQPPKPKFLSFSLPNSANSSPSTLMKKKLKHRSIEPPCQATTLMHQQRSLIPTPDEIGYMNHMMHQYHHHQHHQQQSLIPPPDEIGYMNHTMHPYYQQQQQSLIPSRKVGYMDHTTQHQLRRSKSCGEGRACAPSDEFDLWWAKPSAAVEHNNMHHNNSLSKTHEAIIREGLVVSAKDVETCEDDENDNNDDDKGSNFKCSALCMYLPGFGKAAKAVKTRKEEGGGVILLSRRVSLEKFECGSWASSALVNEIDPMMSSSYFDLPLELIKCSASDDDDVDAPITSAFVFETGRNSSTKSPHDHVRFSTSSILSKPAASPASCVTPRLRKAREDFTAYFDAQSA